MGLFDLFKKSSYEKNKPIYNRWLHERKSGQAQGMSKAEAEEYASQQLTDAWGASSDQLDTALKEGEKNKWGSDRLRDTDKP